MNATKRLPGCIEMACRKVWSKHLTSKSTARASASTSASASASTSVVPYHCYSTLPGALPAAHQTDYIVPPALQPEQRRQINITDLDRTKNGRERIVILGSGWGGYPMARALDHNKFQVVIVSPRSYFVFTPLLASTCVGTLEFRTAMEPIRGRRSKMEYIQGWADNVNFHDRTVTIEEAVVDPKQSHALVSPRNEGKTAETLHREAAEMSAKGAMFDLKYDKLVVAVGSYSQTFGTPGVKEHAHFLKDVGDARRIRKRVLECFEAAELPTTTDEVRRQILSFCLVGGGPTGMETAAELHDFIRQDLAKLYPQTVKFCSVTVYDVAPKVLSAFDDKLVQYALKIFKREGIQVKTSRRIEGLSPGLPGRDAAEYARRPGLTLKIKGEAEVGIGMCIWSTGLMPNPFIASALNEVRRFPADEVIYKAAVDGAASARWTICRDARTGSIVTNDRLRIVLQAEGAHGGAIKAAYMKHVFAIGDCAQLDGGLALPATAQVANQKGAWLAQRLNRGDLQSVRFHYRNLGIMAYIGNMNAIFMGGGNGGGGSGGSGNAGFGGNLSGRAAWLVWRGAYLVKSLSWRNRVLISVYWFLNAVFGRDISRF